MKPVYLWLFFLFFLLFNPLCSGYQFLLQKPMDPLCLVDVSSGDAIVGYYERITNNSSVHQSQEMKITVYDPEKQEVHSEKMRINGRYYINVPKKRIGEEGHMYTVCCEILPNEKHDTSIEAFTLKVYDDGDYFSLLSSKHELKNRQIVNGKAVYSFIDSFGQMKSMLVSKEELLNNEKSAIQMQYQLNDINAEAQKGVIREAYLRSVSESIFTRIWISSVLLAVAIAIAVHLQYAYLMRKVKRRL